MLYLMRKLPDVPKPKMKYWKQTSNLITAVIISKVNIYFKNEIISISISESKIKTAVFITVVLRRFR